MPDLEQALKAGPARAESSQAKHGATSRQPIPEQPYTVFSPRMRICIISLVSISALISPFGATLFYPAMNSLSDILHVSPAMTNIAITTYMVRAQAKQESPPTQPANPKSVHRQLLLQSLAACRTAADADCPSSFASSSLSWRISGWRCKLAISHCFFFASCKLLAVALPSLSLWLSWPT